MSAMAQHLPRQSPDEKSTTHKRKDLVAEQGIADASNLSVDHSLSTSTQGSKSTSKSGSAEPNSSEEQTTSQSDFHNRTKPSTLSRSASVTGISSSAQVAANTSNVTESSGISPYGTRSRNRNGNARPNYAEDRENEMEYEWTSSKKAAGPTIPANTVPPSEGDKVPTTHSRKSVNGSATKATVAPAPVAAPLKEHIPGTSTFSAHSEANSHLQSKKRKAPGSSAVAGTTSKQLAPTTSTRKSAHTASTVSAARETNMMSFETSKAYLSNGCLVADDKTRFKVNGRSPPPTP